MMSELWSCVLDCDPGFFDCNHQPSDGCESTDACDLCDSCDASPWKEGGLTWGYTLNDAPHGLARCGDEVVLVDGNEVLAASVIDSSVRVIALLDHDPAGGLACSNGFVYLPLLRMSDGGGRISRFRLNDAGSDAAPTDLETLVDPARSIDVDDAGGVFWIARTDAGRFVQKSALDASAVSLLAVDEPQIYKTFALQNGLWAIGEGDVRHLYVDGAVDSILNANAVAITARTNDVSLLTKVDGGTWLADASLVDVRAVTSWGDDVFVATDTSILHIPPNGPPVIVVGNVAHSVDVAVDAKYVYFTTIGPPATLTRALW
jgi:hypothetical protein